MIDTFKGLTDDVLRLMGLPSDQGRFRAAVKESIRTKHAERASEDDWSFMRWPTLETIPVVAGVQSYSLHERFRALMWARRRSDGQQIVERSQEMFGDAGYPEIGATGLPGDFTLDAVAQVKGQPTSASVLAVASSAPADATNTVTAAGMTAAGYVEETITVGSSGVQSFLPGQVFWIRKNSTTWAGVLTVTANAGTITILTLRADEWGRNYRQIKFTHIPSASDTVEYQFYRLGKTLSHDNDVPELPYPFSRILVYDALLDLQGLSRPSSGELEQWRDSQQRLLTNAQNTYLDGQSNGAENSYVHFIKR